MILAENACENACQLDVKDIVEAYQMKQQQAKQERKLDCNAVWRLSLVVDPEKLSPKVAAKADRCLQLCEDGQIPISFEIRSSRLFYIGSKSRKGSSLISQLTGLSIDAHETLADLIIAVWSEVQDKKQNSWTVLRDRCAIFFALKDKGLFSEVGLSTTAVEELVAQARDLSLDLAALDDFIKTAEDAFSKKFGLISHTFFFRARYPSPPAQP